MTGVEGGELLALNKQTEAIIQHDVGRRQSIEHNPRT
jgi:hypothetical protein